MLSTVSAVPVQSQYGVIGFFLHLEFTDGSNITMQNDGRNPENLAKDQIKQIEQLGLKSVRTANIDDADIMEGKRCCFGCKRCPSDDILSKYIVGGIMGSIAYTGIWFFIAFKIGGDAMNWESS